MIHLICHIRGKECSFYCIDSSSFYLVSLIHLLSSMSTLGYASKISDSIAMGLSILAKLGEDLPRELSDTEVSIKADSTKSMLDELSVVDLLNYRMMMDTKKLMAMKFLRRLEHVIQQVKPNLQVSTGFHQPVGHSKFI
jgi:hypothetical protein